MTTNVPAGGVGPGMPARQLPTETPECESSTTHGISIPEPVELHNAWPSWLPLLMIGLLAVSFTGFAVARIFGWGT